MKKYSLSLTLLVILLTFANNTAKAQQLPMRLWYDRPATFFEEALPIGNGKMGAMVYGNPDDDLIYLNDLTLWTGKPVDYEEGCNQPSPDGGKETPPSGFPKSERPSLPKTTPWLIPFNSTYRATIASSTKRWPHSTSRVAVVPQFITTAENSVWTAPW